MESTFRFLATIIFFVIAICIYNLMSVDRHGYVEDDGLEVRRSKIEKIRFVSGRHFNETEFLFDDVANRYRNQWVYEQQEGLVDTFSDHFLHLPQDFDYFIGSNGNNSSYLSNDLIDGWGNASPNKSGEWVLPGLCVPHKFIRYDRYGLLSVRPLKVYCRLCRSVWTFQFNRKKEVVISKGKLSDRQNDLL